MRARAAIGTPDPSSPGHPGGHPGAVARGVAIGETVAAHRAPRARGRGPRDGSRGLRGRVVVVVVHRRAVVGVVSLVVVVAFVEGGGASEVFHVAQHDGDVLRRGFALVPREVAVLGAEEVDGEREVSPRADVEHGAHEAHLVREGRASVAHAEARGGLAHGAGEPGFLPRPLELQRLHFGREAVHDEDHLARPEATGVSRAGGEHAVVLSDATRGVDGEPDVAPTFHRGVATAHQVTPEERPVGAGRGRHGVGAPDGVVSRARVVVMTTRAAPFKPRSVRDSS